jgi:hypothetical protein
MHGAYPPFHRSEIAAAELSLEMAIEAVETEAVDEQNAKASTLAGSSLRARGSVTPSQPANQNDEAIVPSRHFWAGIFRRAGDDAQIPGQARPDHSGHGTVCREPRDGWLTELLARASRGVNNNEQDFAPRWPPTQRGGVN